MKWLKIIFWALVVVFVVFLGFTVIGFLYSALWYLFWIGVLFLGGYIGYRVLSKEKKLEIKGVDTVSQIELDNAKIVRELEDYKHRTVR